MLPIKHNNCHCQNNQNIADLKNIVKKSFQMSENKEYIVKHILHAGKAPIDFKDGTKVSFPLSIFFLF